MMDMRICLLLAAFLAAPAWSASPSLRGLEDRLAQCAAQTDDAARLACFDRIVADRSAAADSARPERLSSDRVTSDRRSSSVPAADRSAAAAASSEDVAGTNPGAASAASVEASFGFSGSELARRHGGEQRQASAPPAQAERLNAAVTQVSKRPRGELVVTLDNGQVWAQKTAGYIPLEPGDQVTILKGALRSYRLIANGRSTPVTRVE